MKAGADYLYSTLTGLPFFDQLLPGGLYWAVAPEDTPVKFAVFTLTQEGPTRSKDFDGQYRAVVQVWVYGPGALSEAGYIADQIRGLLRARHGATFRYEGGVSSYGGENNTYGVVEVTLAFSLERSVKPVTTTGSGNDYTGQVNFDDGKGVIYPVLLQGGVGNIAIPNGSYTVAFDVSELGYTLDTLTVEVNRITKEIVLEISRPGGGEEF